MKSRVLHENFLRRMTPEQRKSIGQMSAAEALAKAEVRNERDLQKLIVSYLRYKGIEPIYSGTHRKTSNNRGTADILFAVQGRTRINSIPEPWNFACAWECKWEKGKESVEQQQMAVRLMTAPNVWNWRIVRSLDDCIAALKDMGIS